MNGVGNIATEFRAFTEWLSASRSNSLERLEDIANGFEGWMKIEFLLWLTTVRQPALRLASSADDNFTSRDADVGVEYKLLLDQRHAGMDRQHKQCDIWLRSDLEGLFHYVEIKAPFANGNSGKMLDSAANDFWYMSRIRRSYEQAASGNAIVLGVRFNETTWTEAIERLRYQAKLPEGMHPTALGVFGPRQRIWWCVLTRQYT